MRHKCHHKRQVLVPDSRDMGQRTMDIWLVGENACSSLHAPSTQRDDRGQTAGYVKEKFISNLFYWLCCWTMVPRWSSWPKGSMRVTVTGSNTVASLMIFHCNRQAEGRQSHCMVDKTEALGGETLPKQPKVKCPKPQSTICFFGSGQVTPSGTVSTSQLMGTPAPQPGLLPALAIFIFVVTSTNQGLTFSFW